MDRRAVLGRSKAELFMSRAGHLVGLLCAVLLLPLIPFLAALLLVRRATQSVTGGGNEGVRPTYEYGEYDGPA